MFAHPSIHPYFLVPLPLVQVFFSREAELRAFKRLAARGLGPKLLATFEDGRVEEFLEGQVT